MRVCEVEAKELLAQAGIALPRRRVITPNDSVDFSGWQGGVLKAQLLAGGRGKAGLVRVATSPEELARELPALRQRIAESGREAAVMLEERVDIAHEYYLSLMIDDVLQRPVLLFSLQGGIEIEDAPDSVRRYVIDPLSELRPHQLVDFFLTAGLPAAQLGALVRLAVALYRVFVAQDAELLEINPLVVTRGGKIFPLDAKLVLDESAGFRHRGRRTPLSQALENAEMTPLEREAAVAGFTFVEMPGDVAIMSAGAGMGMMLVDLVGEAGLKPACFVDGAVGGHGDQTAERLRMVLKRAEAPDVRAIMFYQNLGTRDLKPRILTLIDILRETPPPKPFYFGMAATYLAERNMTAKAACALMREHGYIAVEEPNELVARIAADLG